MQGSAAGLASRGRFRQLGRHRQREGKKMKPIRRKFVRRSFMAAVTGASALTLQACGSDAERAAGNNSAGETAPAATDQDS